MWRAALARYDVVVTADVGTEADAQRNMNTKLVILPSGDKSRELVEAWVEAGGHIRPLFCST